MKTKIAEFKFGDNWEDIPVIQLLKRIETTEWWNGKVNLIPEIDQEEWEDLSEQKQMERKPFRMTLTIPYREYNITIEIETAWIHWDRSYQFKITNAQNFPNRIGKRRRGRGTETTRANTYETAIEHIETFIATEIEAIDPHADERDKRKQLQENLKNHMIELGKELEVTFHDSKYYCENSEYRPSPNFALNFRVRDDELKGEDTIYRIHAFNADLTKDELKQLMTFLAGSKLSIVERLTR